MFHIINKGLTVIGHAHKPFTNFNQIVKKTSQTINSVLGMGRKYINIPYTFVNNGSVLSGAAEISEGPELNKKFSDYL